MRSKITKYALITALRILQEISCCFCLSASHCTALHSLALHKVVLRSCALYSAKHPAHELSTYFFTNPYYCITGTVVVVVVITGSCVTVLVQSGFVHAGIVGMVPSSHAVVVVVSVVVVVVVVVVVIHA